MTELWCAHGANVLRIRLQLNLLSEACACIRVLEGAASCVTSTTFVLQDGVRQC